MYDSSVKDPCRYGLDEHHGERICVRCGAIYDEEKQKWIITPNPNITQ